MLHPLADQIWGFHVKDGALPDSIGEWIWLCAGVGGSLFFGLRFFLQWLHSEKHKESRIPISFWWLSNIATIMNGSYFIHKEQWVALLGNGPQIVPYIRNLVLIYRKRRDDEKKLEAASAPDVVSPVTNP